MATRQRSVTWRTLTAQYAPSELVLMRKLPEYERWFIHAAKSLFKGGLR